MAARAPWIVVLLVAVSLGGSACRRPAAVREYKFSACSARDPEATPADRSYAALLGALARSGFQISSTDAESRTIRATLVGRTMLVWNLSVGPNGEVRVPASQLAGANVRREAQWARRVEREYNDRRCLPYAKLREEAAVLAGGGRGGRTPALPPPGPRDNAQRNWDDLDDDLER